MSRHEVPPRLDSIKSEERLQVLIVDDEEYLRNALLKLVRAEGYVGEAVPDGASALGLLAVKRPELIILDLMMPVMDGYEFMERLALQMGRWRPRVILLSAAERLDLVQARFDADAYIQKPFDADRLRAALKRLVRPVVQPMP